MIDLDKITARFDRAYSRNKSAKTWLEKSQKKLFEAFTTELEHQPLSQYSVPVPRDLLHTDDYIKKHHPGWRLLYTVPGTQQFDQPMAVIGEDPSLMKYEHVNQQTGTVIGRTLVEGSPSLDDERLRDENPPLWERITEWPEPWFSLVRNAFRHFTTLTWSPEALDAVVAEHLIEHGVQRVLKDLKTIADADLARVQEYLIPGPISVRLVPPRKAKPEELEANE